MNKIPLTLYVHIPWCVRKCPYCDFNSHSVKGELPETDYVRALIEDLAANAHLASGRSIDAIFFGGGTPSLFSPPAFSRILDAAQRFFRWAPNIEITMEANPGAREHGPLRGYRDSGINRISLGVQSFNPKHLCALGRIHDDKAAHQAIVEAKNAGFNSINLDLMYGLPKQTLHEAMVDLETAIDLEPEHLSWYHLTLEPNTLFYHQKPPIPNADQAFEIQDRGLSLIESAGYERYEVSAYSKPKFQCRHNLNYWRFGDYLGIGAGAHSKITDKTGQIQRFYKAKHPKAYLESPRSNHGARNLETGDRVFEFMMNGLRLKDGVCLKDFTEFTRLAESEIAGKLRTATEAGLAEVRGGRFVPTARGYDFLNDLVNLFAE